MINTRRISEQITRALMGAGLRVRESLSGLSSSRYLTVDRYLRERLCCMAVRGVR